MAMPKSVTKITKEGVQFVSNVNRIEYTIAELSRAALRDTGKYLRREIKTVVPVAQGVLKQNVGTWVRRKKDTGEIMLHVGVYSRKRAKQKGYTYAYHAHLVEFGTVKTKANPFLSQTVLGNIDQIRTIQGQYLSAVEDENKALGLIDEEEEIADD